MADGAFNPGTGTLKSTDLVNAFCELAMLVQTEERECAVNATTITANNLTVPDNVAITANFNTDTMTVSIPALPLEIDYNPDSGKIEIVASDYLEPINAVVPDVDHTLTVTGSDLTATSKVKALLELAQLIQEDEAIVGINNMAFTVNGDTNTASLTATFAGIPQVNSSGKIEFACTNYLVSTP
jgi:hypothetical protein